MENTLLTALDRAQEKLRTIKGLAVAVESFYTLQDTTSLREDVIKNRPTELELNFKVFPDGLAPVDIRADYLLEDIISEKPNYIDKALHIEESLHDFTQEDVYTLRLGYLLFKTYQATLTGSTVPTLTDIQWTVESNWQDPDLSLDYLKLAE